MEFAGLLGVRRRKEKLKLERNKKKKKNYLLYIISIMGNGPSCPGPGSGLTNGWTWHCMGDCWADGGLKIQIGY